MKEEITIELEKDNIEMTIENNEKVKIYEKYDDTEIKESLNNKVDKIEGKMLSENDFTDDLKDKLINLSNYDDTSLKTQIQTNTDNIEKIDTKLIENDTKIEEITKEIEGFENYDDTEIKSEIEEIKQKNIDQDERLNNIKEYDDTYIRESLKNKVEKEEGKGLTTNDFTNTYKEKLDSIRELGGYDDTIIQNKIEKLKEENKLLKSQIPERTRKRRIYTYKR